MKNNRFALACWCLAGVLLLLPLLGRLAILLSAGPTRLHDVVEFLFDDGYYYLAIAANVAQTGHSTLDGLTATNGYQPLWLIVLSGFARLVGTQTWTFFVASCALIYVIACAGPAMALLWLRTRWAQAALCMGAGLSIVVIQQPDVFLEGLEPILFVPLAVPFVMLLEGDTGTRRMLQLSAVLAAAFLVRLDSLALCVAAAAVVTVREWLSLRAAAHSASAAPARTSLLAGLRPALLLTVFVVPTVIVYLAVNQVEFGSAVPVSGIAKMIGGPKFSNWGIATEFFSKWKSFGFLLVIWAALEWLARRRSAVDGLFFRSAVVISLAAIIQCVYYCAFSTWNVWPWYSYLIALDMAVVVARIVYLASSVAEVAQLRPAVIAAVGLLLAWTVYRGGIFFEWSVTPERLARVPSVFRARSPLPPGTRSFNDVSLSMLDDFFNSGRPIVIAMGDRAGGLAYWGRSRVSLVQTEGLTLDAEYIRARLAHRAGEYLASRYPIALLVIDREHIPTLRFADGQTHFVIPDPIQGRLTLDPVPVFCFPATAVRYQHAYRGQYGTNTRMAFDFAAREPCPQEALDMVQAAGKTVGLRRFSLPSEYLN